MAVAVKRLLARKTARGSNDCPVEQIAAAYDSEMFDTETVDLFWEWARSGCPQNGSNHQGLDHMAEATSSNEKGRLGLLAGSKSAWVRFAAACNPLCPAWAMWGDGEHGWGLVNDPNLWVRSAAVLNMPTPPASAIKMLLPVV